MKERNSLRKRAENLYGIIRGKINFTANKYEVMRELRKGSAAPTVMYDLESIEVGEKKVGNCSK